MQGPLESKAQLQKFSKAKTGWYMATQAKIHNWQVEKDRSKLTVKVVKHSRSSKDVMLTPGLKYKTGLETIKHRYKQLGAWHEITI